MPRPTARRAVRALSLPRRMAARALATLVLLAHGATVGHELLARHELCLEHGERIHAGEAHGHAHASAGTQAAETDAEAVIQSAAAAAVHDHDHCGLACSRSKLTITQPGASIRPAATSEVAAPVPALATAAERSALYRLAPKQSPPV